MLFIEISRNIRKFTILLLFAIAILISCTSNQNIPNEIYQEEFLFNTLFSVRIFGEENGDAQADCDSLFDLLRAIENSTNFYDSSSSLGILNKQLLKKASVKITDPFLMEVLRMGLNVFNISEGGFDPTIGKISGLWPFGADQPILPDPKIIRENLQWVNSNRIRLTDDGLQTETVLFQIDLSAVNKGFAVEKAVQWLADRGYENVIVDAGGNLGIRWNRTDSIEIFIRHPENPGKMIGSFFINHSTAIATSGDYMNYFEIDGKRYHHILDPMTGYPSDSASSVTIITQNAGLADGLATGLFTKGITYGLTWCNNHPHTTGIFIRADINAIFISKTDKLHFSLLDSSYRIEYR
ncbi:MAG: FAD:protein FMN transferase [Calditrichia bacterium]